MISVNTVSEVLARSVADHADRVALRFCITSECPLADPIANAYPDQRLGAEALAYSRVLAGCGAARGDMIALLCENRPEWVVAYFAIHQLGAVLVPIDGSLKADSITHILQRSGARILIASRQCASLAADATGNTEIRVRIVEDDLAGLAAPTAVDPESLVCPEVGPDDLAVLSFTSGTTGASKGIMLSHRNVVSNATVANDVLGFTPDDRMLSILPANHMFEQTVGMLLPLAVGAGIYYPGSRSPRVLFEAMADAKPTYTLMVPALARLIQAKIKGQFAALPPGKRRAVAIARDLSRCSRRLGIPLGRRLFARVHKLFGGSLRFVICGGAALESDVAEFFLDIGLPMLQGYGLTETSPVISTNSVAHHRVGSVGQPIPQTQVRLRPIEGAADDQIGELCVHGPNVMTGYFEDPAATDEAFDDDGWLRTGDLARIDRAGYIHIVGRAKDVIVNKAGKNIYPGEIEAALAGSPHITEACAVGVCTDPASTNETVAALVLPDPDALGDIAPADLDRLLRREAREACDSLPDYKRPKLLAIWPDDQFPRTATLKIKKHEVRQRLDALDLRPL